MIAEWGVYHRITKPADKAAVFNSVLPELEKRPAIKAIVYFDTARTTKATATSASTAARKRLAAFRSSPPTRSSTSSCADPINAGRPPCC